MTPERIVGILVLLTPLIVGLFIPASHGLRWLVERRDNRNRPPEPPGPTPGQPVQGMTVLPPTETPLEAERKERITSLKRELSETERELRRVSAERALYREELIRRGYEFPTSKET